MITVVLVDIANMLLHGEISQVMFLSVFYIYFNCNMTLEKILNTAPPFLMCAPLELMSNVMSSGKHILASCSDPTCCVGFPGRVERYIKISFKGGITGSSLEKKKYFEC